MKGGRREDTSKLRTLQVAAEEPTGQASLSAVSESYVPSYRSLFSDTPRSPFIVSLLKSVTISCWRCTTSWFIAACLRTTLLLMLPRPFYTEESACFSLVCCLLQRSKNVLSGYRGELFYAKLRCSLRLGLWIKHPCLYWAEEIGTWHTGSTEFSDCCFHYSFPPSNAHCERLRETNSLWAISTTVANLTSRKAQRIPFLLELERGCVEDGIWGLW